MYPSTPRRGGAAGRSPALRLFDWLFLRGTIDGYQAPALHPQLRGELNALYRPRPDDLPSESVTAHELDGFLAGHMAGASPLRRRPRPAREAASTALGEAGTSRP